MRLDDIPTVKLTTLPTPLEEAPRLASILGLHRLLIKRDDCTTLAGGGNKARKLEYLMADALAKGADVVLTDGGPQSNHARMTAGAARKLGIEDCILFLGGPRFDRFYGNLLLDVVLGAEIRFMEDATVKDMEKAMWAEADELLRRGRKPYVIPIGGSTPLGSLGYVQGIRELAGQLEDRDKSPLIFVPVGSAGTMAGCALGVRLFLPQAELIGISVARKSKPLRIIAAENANGAAKLIGVDETFTPDDLIVNDEYYGERYGVPSEPGNRAILTAARTEGLILDPVYTGKAMSGLIDLAKTGAIDRDRTVIFIHTGGTPGLNAFEDQFRTLAKFSSVDFKPMQNDE
ncbi:MAG: D-cysteine desulfhydrase family protein [Armatimonadetes bacterium]|nr:D-cysteine desulfhydrase family protein [Armatimonadota bacterium]